MTDTPPPSPTDELLDMMCEAACEAEGQRWSEVNGSIAYLGLVNAMVAALRRIRPLLEARGMEMAAEHINYGIGEFGATKIRVLARRHAEGGK